jgi:hypothetical protein
MIDQLEIPSVDALLDAIRSESASEPRRPNWYRGHSDATWHLTPAVHRRYSTNQEVGMTTRFRLGAPTRYPNCPPSDDFAKWLSLMQHFGLPTRLLDWTESPLIGAFFAVAYEPRSGPAAVWRLWPTELNKTFIGRPGLKVLPSVTVEHLLRPAFTSGDSPDEVLAVIGQDVDLRMTVQQGGFTIHGKSNPLEEHFEAAKFLRKFVIPQEARENFRRDLWLLGIRRSMLFPDIANLAQELAGERLYQRGVEPADDAAEQLVGPERG